MIAGMVPGGTEELLKCDEKPIQDLVSNLKASSKPMKKYGIFWNMSILTRLTPQLSDPMILKCLLMVFLQPGQVLSCKVNG